METKVRRKTIKKTAVKYKGRGTRIKAEIMFVSALTPIPTLLQSRCMAYMHTYMFRYMYLGERYVKEAIFRESVEVINMPNFIKIGSDIQKFTWQESQTAR
jgi:hypothetical protein